VLALLARDTGKPRLAFQLLWYPVTTWDLTLPSFAENANAPILDLSTVRVLLDWYAGGVDLGNPPHTLAPAAAESHAGLPAAFIGTAGHDPLRDDGLRYAELLAAAGVPVELQHSAALVHGYACLDGMFPAVTHTVDAGLAALRAALHSQVNTQRIVD
jgi:acetyl esterase/lipase